MGWLLGLGGVISAITLAFWVGAATGLILVLVSKLNSLSRLFKNLTIKSEIPFAPFLIIGTALVFFTEINILNISFF
jgi:prepilin signal peptidase PulO-like enzyme (type II secretory pathway)